MSATVQYAEARIEPRNLNTAQGVSELAWRPITVVAAHVELWMPEASDPTTQTRIWFCSGRSVVVNKKSTDVDKDLT